MMPFDFRLALQMFRLALRDANSTRRRKVLWFLVFVWPLLAAFDALCFALDGLLFPGLRKVEIRDPVFVIGHARSGTTLMHRLLCADRERFVWVRTWELFLPSILQRRLVRGLARLDARLLRGSLAARIRAWEDRAFRKGRQMHPMSLDGPEEDEFWMAIPFCSSYVGTVFPYLRELQPWNRFDEGLPEWKRRRIMAFYRECVRRQLYLDGPGKTYLSKNPVASEKVRSLIETFPGARFVVMLRDPCETIPSLQKMMERNWKASGCDRERVSDSLAVLFENSIGMYLHPFEVLDARSDVSWTAVRYEELVEKPRAVVERVYRELGLEIGPQLAESLAREEERSREYRAEHLYSLEEYGLSAEQIRARLAPLFERFGWSAPPEPER